MKKDLTVFDLDGTLALIAHRHHFLEGRKKNWRKFFAACVNDPPNCPVIKVLQGLHHEGYEIWIVSGRSDEVREETVRWLQQHEVPYHHLIMRRAGDFTADDVLKRSWLVNGIIPKDRVLIVFDDRDKVVAMWRREGLTCAQVAPGNF
jgi:phosphoglycolate phosphatase-like HAD superfamily hydrolase